MANPSSQPDSSQLEALLKLTAQRLGTTPQALKDAAQRGDLSHLVEGAGPEAGHLKKVLTDPQAAKKLLSSPQAQNLLRMLGRSDSSAK